MQQEDGGVRQSTFLHRHYNKCIAQENKTAQVEQASKLLADELYKKQRRTERELEECKVFDSPFGLIAGRHYSVFEQDCQGRGRFASLGRSANCK